VKSTKPSKDKFVWQGCELQFACCTERVAYKPAGGLAGTKPSRDKLVWQGCELQFACYTERVAYKPAGGLAYFDGLDDTY